jgi:small basic protein
MKKLIALLMLPFVLLLVTPQLSSAADVLPDTETVNQADTIASIRLDAATVTLIISVFIPIVTGLLTKYGLPGWIKTLITLALNAISAAVVAARLADGSAVVSQSVIVSALIAFGLSVVAYESFWVKLNVTSSKPEGKLAPSRGL